MSGVGGIAGAAQCGPVRRSGSPGLVAARPAARPPAEPPLPSAG
ncbi:hypothetical protein ACO0M4_35470 [Streptomyces sp. RGM 3693]